MSFWDGKRILVTGGAGFLGSFLVEQLKSSGVKEEDVAGAVAGVPAAIWLQLDIPIACESVWARG